MSFQERSISASLLITLVVWVYCFFRVYQHTADGVVSIEALGGLLIGAVIMTVIIEIVVQAIIAGVAARKSTAAGLTDERDRTILYRASYGASYVLVAGIVMSVIVGLVTKNLVITLNTLVLHFIASEVWRYVAQLWFYRRGL